MKNSNDFDLKNNLLLPIKSYGESQNNSKEDYKYDKPIEYWLLVIGYAIGYGSFWRFPYLIYTCGGGVFFIPFFIFFFLISIPIFTLESTYGQIFKKGPVEMFTYINKKFEGIGWASVIVSFIVSLYYAIILCWSVFFFFQSFISPLPWSKEANLNKNYKIGNFTNNSTASNEEYVNIDYFPKEVLGISGGLENMGGLNSHLAICLILTYFLIYYCISEGIKSSSKVVYFTAPAPVLLLLVLFIKALTLPGIGIGLKYLFYPNIWKLFDLDVWIKASNQVVYVLNIGMGGNMIFSSYRNEKEDIYFSSFWLPMLTIFFGILCAIINFSYLGYFSYVVNIPIEKLPLSGTDLAFTTYPSALCMLPFPNFWAIIFFFILITLGIDSQFAFNENVSHYCHESFLKKYLTKNQTTKLICIVGLLLGLPFVMEGGFYLFELVDDYSTNACFLISFFECYILTNYIGEDTLKNLIKKKTGKEIPQYVYDSINKFAPYSLGGLFVLSFLGSIVPKHYILWAFIIQIIIIGCPLIAIIGFFYLYKDEPVISLIERKRIIELQGIN